MRTVISVLIATCIQQFCNAQTIPLDSFFVPGATWTQAIGRHSLPCGMTPAGSTWALIYKIERDSVVGSITYHLLSQHTRKGYTEWHNCPPLSGAGTIYYPASDSTLPEVFAMIRTDSDRAYLTLLAAQYGADAVDVCDSAGMEYLLFDFNLVPGSNIIGSTVGGTINVAAIDSVSLSNGTFVKRYQSIYGDNYSIIYGIGQKSGFINYQNLYTCNSEALYANQKLLCYDNPHFSYHFDYPPYTLNANLQYNCFNMAAFHDSVTAVNNAVSGQDIALFPNPAANKLTIQASTTIYSVSISTVTGQVLYTGKHNAKEVQLDLSKMPAGIYFIRINNSEMRKFVRE